MSLLCPALVDLYTHTHTHTQRKTTDQMSLSLSLSLSFFCCCRCCCPCRCKNTFSRVRVGRRPYWLWRRIILAHWLLIYYLFCSSERVCVCVVRPCVHIVTPPHQKKKEKKKKSETLTRANHLRVRLEQNASQNKYSNSVMPDGELRWNNRMKLGKFRLTSIECLKRWIPRVKPSNIRWKSWKRDRFKFNEQKHQTPN